MRRDTLMVRPNGNMVLRFRADNPGVWLFHCHIEWHVDSGLIATMVEAPLQLQASLGAAGAMPDDHYTACARAGTPTTGNAAGNTKDLLDLTGQNRPPNRLPDGFTAKGIVAMTFSCVAALLGMAFIAWYGLADMGAAELETETRRIAALDAEEEAEAEARAARLAAL
jgi:iron transport multicopper oxidase